MEEDQTGETSWEVLSYVHGRKKEALAIRVCSEEVYGWSCLHFEQFPCGKKSEVHAF
jgi:hypothetical protein